MTTFKSALFQDILTDDAVVIAPEEGEKYETQGMSIQFKVTSDHTRDQMGVYAITLAPNTIGAKLHYHRFMDETFIITEGSITMSIGDKEIIANEGTIAHIPRFTPHGFRNDSDKSAKLLLLFNPGQQRENFFRGLHEILEEHPINPDQFLNLYHKYDSIPVDVKNIIQIEE